MTEAANGLGRALVAEFIGTFALIFIGAGAAIALGVNHDPPVAFAHGLTILVFVAAFATSAAAILIRPSRPGLR
jgi:glycerol uptake facilitator-like aquaporin